MGNYWNADHFLIFLVITLRENTLTLDKEIKKNLNFYQNKEINNV